MDSSAILSKLRKSVSAHILEEKRFGRSELQSVWVQTQGLRAVLQAARDEAGLDWLENFSIMELNGAFVVSYFLRSSAGPPERALVVRAVPEAVKGDEYFALPSVRDLFLDAQGFETEAEELFGASFSGDSAGQKQGGFPLRRTGGASR